MKITKEMREVSVAWKVIEVTARADTLDIFQKVWGRVFLNTSPAEAAKIVAVFPEQSNDNLKWLYGYLCELAAK